MGKIKIYEEKENIPYEEKQNLFDRNMILLSIGVVFLTILFSISYLNNKIRYGLILGIVILLYYKREQIKEMLRMIKKNKN